MEPENINNTLLQGERVTSTYAEIFFHDKYCCPESAGVKTPETDNKIEHGTQEKEWVSPSDLLMPVLELHPPFTSKITRGITHEGILAIGNEVLDKERTSFLKSLNDLLNDNDASWDHILTHEKEVIINKVKNIYQNIFTYKSNIMKDEITLFYENTLQELENHLKKETHITLQTIYANIVSDSNRQIQQNLLEEKKKLEKVLQKKYLSEIEKVKKYYSLLLHNELYRNNKLINKAIYERNDAIKAFYKQIEEERITSTMYVMSLERKKCKIQKMLLENLHSSEVLDKMQTIIDKNNIIKDFKQNFSEVSEINKQWEQKIKKILQLFLKFISFSLKIIPEQSSFLLCMEKMVILQLKEFQKNPHKTTNILINEELESNIFTFEQPERDLSICDKKPFVIVGDLSDPLPTKYGSRETLPSNVDLPYFRVGRRFIYAKCHGYEHVKSLLEAQKCKCRIPPPAVKKETSDKIVESEQIPPLVEYESSLESLFLDNIERFQNCPARKCNKWIDRYSFPDLRFYLDYSEDNFRRVTAILDPSPPKEPSPSLIDPKTIAYTELPFSATKEPFHNIETQFSSEEDLSPKVVCPCIEKNIGQKILSQSNFECTSEQKLEEILGKRKRSLEQLISKNPNLLKILTDEAFDYKL